MPDIAVMTLENVTVDNPNLPRLSADPLVRRGTLLLWDFARPAGYPAQANPTQSPTDATHANETVVNLANTADLGRLYAETNGDIARVVFSRGLDAQNVGNQFIVQGPNLRLGQGSFVFIAWATLRQIQGQQFFAGLMGQAVSTNGDGTNNAWALDVGGDGATPRFLWWNPNATDNAPLGMAIGQRTGLHQIAFVADVTSHTLTAYVDGTQVAQEQVDASWGGFRATTLNLGMGAWNAMPSQNGFRGILHRLLIENLSVSGRNGADVVQADWEANRGRLG